MPWRLRKELALILFGCFAVIASVIVWILNQDASSDVLAAVGFIGGLAIIINSLPDGNGNH